MRAETGRQGVTLLDPSWEHVYQAIQIFTTLHMSVNDFKSMVVNDLGVTNKF